MRRAIGRGLSQLIAEEFEGTPNEAPTDAIAASPFQPRRVFDDGALEELASSIREHGILQPLLVRPVGEDRYELIAGERRLRAAKLAGLRSVPILVRDADDRDTLELAIIENVQREDIGPLERAQAYRRLIDEFGLTQEQVAERVGKARVSVTNTMRLLRLPNRIQAGIDDALITEGHARALLAIEDADRQERLYDRILEEGLTVRDVERLGRLPKPPNTPRPRKEESPKDPNVKALEEALAIHMGSPVHIQPGSPGGKLIVEFYSDDDLDRLLEAIGFVP